jgi:hypothetical protein
MALGDSGIGTNDSFHSTPGAGGVACGGTPRQYRLCVGRHRQGSASAGRGDAFEAAEFCIDVLRSSVPVWKLECTSTESQWVETGVLIETVAASAEQWDRDRASSRQRRKGGTP